MSGSSVFLDEWVSTDTGKTILYTVTLADGSTPDYTAASAISLVAVCKSPQKSFTIGGAVSNGPSRIFSFVSPCEGVGYVAPSAAGARETYDFRVTYTLGGKVYWTSPGRLSIVRFP